MEAAQARDGKGRQARIYRCLIEKDNRSGRVGRLLGAVACPDQRLKPRRQALLQAKLKVHTATWKAQSSKPKRGETTTPWRLKTDRSSETRCRARNSA